MDVRHFALLARQPAAAVKPRESFLSMPKRGLAFLLANVMFWQPMWAQADGIVVANPNKTLDRAGNGVPIKFVTQFEDGTLSNIKKSTLFPESWTDALTINAVKLVGDTKPVATRTSDGASLYQSTVNGVRVEVIKVGDNVTAGYPCGAGCASAQSFMGQ